MVPAGSSKDTDLGTCELGTSIRETLADADWAMKCLHVGVRSDRDKKVFQNWSETSKLTNLRTREDFNEDFPGASIIMQCDSVNVNEEKKRNSLYWTSKDEN